MRRRLLLGSLAVVVFVGIAALALRHEVWLTVPEALRGAAVYADGREVATVDDPNLTVITFWFRKTELRVEKAGYKPIRLALAAGTKQYPQITEDELVVSNSAKP